MSELGSACCLHSVAPAMVSPTSWGMSHMPSTPSMSFHAELIQQTTTAHERLVGIPIIQGCLRGDVSLPSYVAFLSEAYHRACHTEPLLRACQAALPAQHALLGEALQAMWPEQQQQVTRILGDLRTCCVDGDTVRRSRAPAATEVLVAYAYDTVTRGNPLGLLGLLQVMRRTRATLAGPVVDRLQSRLQLPDSACRHLRTCEATGLSRSGRFATLVNRITDMQDQADVLHATRMFYRLYGDVIRSLPVPQRDIVSCQA
jgi:hypothetical protein